MRSRKRRAPVRYGFEDERYLITCHILPRIWLGLDSVQWKTTSLQLFFFS